MSDTDLKPCDLLEFSKMCGPEYNKPEFSDRVLVFDVMHDGWETTELGPSSSELVATQSNDSGETSSGKRSLEIADKGPEQKRRKKIETNNSVYSGSETAPTCEQANSGTVSGTGLQIETGNIQCDKENEGDIKLGEKEEINQVEKCSSSASYASKGDVSQNGVISDSNGMQANCNKLLRQQKISVHSLWLSVQSPYFRSLFHWSGMKETRDTEVHIKIQESEEKAHLTLLEAMYHIDVLNDKTVDELLTVLELADKYDIKFIFKKCKYVLQKNVTTFEISTQIMYMIKVKHNMNDVEDLAATLQLVLAEEFSPLDEKWQSKKFSSLSAPSLKYLLSSDNLIVQSENTVFHALVYWMEQNGVDPARSDLLTVVRFKLVTIDYLYNVVNNHPVASKMPNFTEFYIGGMTYHAMPLEQKKLLKEKPVLRKKAERTIIQYKFLVKKQDYETLSLSDEHSNELNSDEFWACGYKMSVRLGLEDFGFDTFLGYPCICIHNLNTESFVPLKFAIEKEPSKNMEPDTHDFKLDSCMQIFPCTSLSSSDFNNESETCTLCVAVAPM